MNRRDRNKQKKKKARQERLRQEKHLRQSQPREDDEDDWDDEDFGDPDDLHSFGPSSFEMERSLRNMERAMAERGLETDADVQQFMEEYNRDPDAYRGSGAGPADLKEAAQELAYDAMEEPDSDESLQLAREALRLDPECVDALATVAQITARSADELITRLEEAVETGARALGTAFFAEEQGRFWGIVVTRPYMRTRAALADLQRTTGRLTEAIGHFEALLELNPNDNQGNRDPLLGCYLAAGNLEGAKRLLDEYGAAGLAVFAWGEVLEQFLRGDLEEAAATLAEARQQNRHVEAFLTGARPVPRETEPFYQPGRESEAIRAADFLLPAWQRHPDALAWLKSANPPTAPIPRGRPKRSSSTEPVDEDLAAGLTQGPLDNFFLSKPARKWLDQLLAGEDSYPIVKALDPVLDVPADLVLKTSVCCEMLVAAELVAAGLGRPSHHLPPRAARWLLDLDVVFSPGVIGLAAKAVKRVGEFSELRSFWDTVGEGQDWLRGVEDLHSRLHG
jgi:tetratricopeptide (TPR) repeat protein